MKIPIVGLGVDVHAFAQEDENSELWVAGLHWEGNGLDGHSDGDPIAHAIADALLNAARLGDLGSNFGVAEPEWAGAPGVKILSETARRVREAGYEIGNVSAQLIGNKPKFSPQRKAAEEVLTKAIGARVTISATTTDGLGFTGKGEGLAGLATALIYEI
ncbi:MAG: 2-C-methyl-D-erythritol 2,4-cyclodiphosphate synthase [Micrococcaceae bacterium]